MPRSALPALDALDAVLFDAGGTLVELDYAFIAARVRERGHAVTPSALRRGEAEARRQVDAEARGEMLSPDAQRRAHYFARLLEAAGVPRELRAAVVDALEAAHAETNLWRVAVDGAARTLAGLRALGLRTAVISNSDGRVEAQLASVGLTPHLGLILDSHFEGVEKPHPEIFRRALSRLEVAAARALYVGDIYAIDVVGARCAGLVPVLLDPVAAYADADCVRVAHLESLLRMPSGGPPRGPAPGSSR